MQITIDLDDELPARAQSSLELEEPTAVIHAALTALIQREAARRLALLGGTSPI